MASVFANVEVGPSIEVFELTKAFQQDTFPQKVILGAGSKFIIHLTRPFGRTIFRAWKNEFATRLRIGHSQGHLDHIPSVKWSENFFSLHNYLIHICVFGWFFICLLELRHRRLYYVKWVKYMVLRVKMLLPTHQRSLYWLVKLRNFLFKCNLLLLSTAWKYHKNTHMCLLSVERSSMCVRDKYTKNYNLNCNHAMRLSAGEPTERLTVCSFLCGPVVVKR